MNLVVTYEKVYDSAGEVIDVKRVDHQSTFLEEAERLREERRTRHQHVDIRSRALAQDMAFDFADPEVTDIILIGHGNISSLWTDNDKYFDRQDAAKAVRHLKQGMVEQRMCGNFADRPEEVAKPNDERQPRFRVPLGTFVVCEPANVLAAVNKVVPDVNPPDELFQPVYANGQPLLPQIYALNEQFAGALLEKADA